MTLVLTVLLAACSRSEPKPADSSWVSGIKTWYCGAEILQGKDTPEDQRAGRSRDMAMKLTPTEDSFTGIYALQNAGETYIGSLGHFQATADRSAKLQWKNDHKQKGEATFTFAPDFSSVTVTWQVGAEAQSGGSTLKAAAGPAECVAGKLIK